MTRWQQFKEWLVEPSPRFYLFLLALLIGSIASAGIFIGRSALDKTSEEAVSRAEGDTLTKGEIHALVNRLVKIESPSKKEFARRIERALTICLRSKKCRHTFVLVSRRSGVTIVPTPGATGDGPPDGRTIPQHSNPPPQQRRPAVPQRPSSPGRPPPSSTPPPAQTPPSVQVPGNPPPGTPVPPPVITAPLPSLCTPIINVNCPPPQVSIDTLPLWR